MLASSMGQRGLLVTTVILTALAAPRADGRTRSSAVDGVSQSSRGCVYSFQVWTPNQDSKCGLPTRKWWTPNQDVLAKLRRLEQRCDTVRSSVDREVRLQPQTTRPSARRQYWISWIRTRIVLSNVQFGAIRGWRRHKFTRSGGATEVLGQRSPGAQPRVIDLAQSPGFEERFIISFPHTWFNLKVFDRRSTLRLDHHSTIQ